MTGRERPSRSLVNAVTDAAIAELLPADRRLSMAAAEHRDRALVDAAVDRLLPRDSSSDAQRARGSVARRWTASPYLVRGGWRRHATAALLQGAVSGGANNRRPARVVVGRCRVRRRGG